MTMDKKNMAQIANKVTKDVLAGFSSDDSGFKQMFSEMMADALKEATSPLIQKIDEQREMIEALQGGVEKVGKATKKERKKKDPNAPKRKSGPYIMYSQHQRAVLKESGIEKVPLKALAQMWKQESDEVKQLWAQWGENREEDQPEPGVNAEESYTNFVARAAIDTDGDGKISADELAAAKSKTTAQKDILEVCTLSREEVDKIGTKDSTCYKIAQIKEALAMYGLDVTGNKAEKVQRLKDHCISLIDAGKTTAEGADSDYDSANDDEDE